MAANGKTNSALCPVVMKWLQHGNARNMLMTVSIKLSIIVIAEIIPSTDDVYFKAFLLKMDRAKYCTWTGGIPNSTPANHQCESISSILPVVSTIIATVCRTVRHNY